MKWDDLFPDHRPRSLADLDVTPEASTQASTQASTPCLPRMNAACLDEQASNRQAEASTTQADDVRQAVGKQDTPRTRRNRLGGQRRHAALSPDRRREIARQGALAMHKKRRAQKTKDATPVGFAPPVLQHD